MNLINSPLLIRKENERGIYYVQSSELDSWDKKDEVTLEDRNTFIQNTLKQIDEEQRKLEDIREMKEEDRDSNQYVLSRQVQDGNKNVESIILNQVGLSRYCCRSHMIGHVQVIDTL
jgi:DNA-directed RNA polymerase subunit N (RpoN/RPB10)